MRVFWALLICMICSIAQAQGPNQYNIFTTFTAMKNPQSDVPIGAKWVNDIGPVSDAEPESNTITTYGVSKGVITSKLQNQLTLSLLYYFGLTGTQKKSFQASFSDLTFIKVRDITKLSHVKAGDQFIFQAVKAKNITIKADNNLAAGIKAVAEAKNLGISLGTSGADYTELYLDGSNLFIAYQVVELGKSKIKQIVKTHDGKEITLDKTYRIRFCQCDEGTPLTIEIQNLKAASPSGKIETRRIGFDPIRDRLNEYTLEPVFTGRSIIAANIHFSYLVKQECTPLDGVTKNGKPVVMCGEKKFPKDHNKVKLTSTEFSIQSVETPTGPY